MRSSRPVAILAFLAIALAVTGWMKPAPQPPTHKSVLLSTATYDKLAAWAQTHPGTDGHSLTVAQAVDALANR